MCAAVTGVTLSVTSGQEAVATSPPPTALRGTFAAASTAHELTVAAFAVPDAAALAHVPVGGRLDLVRLPQSAVSVSGASYAVRVSPTQLPPRVRSSGSTTFEVLAQDPSTGQYGITTATAIYSSATRRWSSVDPTPIAGSARVAARGVVANGSLVSAPALAASVRARPASDDGEVVWGKRKSAWASIGSAFPAGGQKSWMTYESTKGVDYSTTLGVAVAYNKVGADYSQRGTKSLSRAFGFEWDPSPAQRRYQVGVNYRHAAIDLGPNPTTVRYLSEWVPISYNGGTHDARGLARPTWYKVRSHCKSQSQGSWHRASGSGHSYENSAGVHLAFADVSLSSKRAYSHEAELYYRNHRGQVLCGNNADPLHAGAIMQRK